MKNSTTRIVSLLMVLLMLITAVPYTDISAASEETEQFSFTVTDTAVDSSVVGKSADESISFFSRAVYSGSYGAQLSGAAKDYYDAMVSEYAVKKNTGTFSFTLESPLTFTAALSGNTIISNEEYEEVRYTLAAAIQISLDAFLYDHPEVFWLRNVGSSYSISILGRNGSMYDMQISTIKITPNEIYSGASEKLSQYSSAVNSALASITVSDSRYDTLKNIHDYICNNAYYAYGNSNYYVHSSESFFLRDGAVVCEGYAKTFKVICDRLGIPCALIVGDAGGAHMWNYVQMEDGKWYLIDATWDDQDSEIYYTYFLACSNTVGFDDVKISEERSADNDFSGKGYFSFTYPVLSSTTYVAHTHLWANTYTTDKAATCTENGSKSIHCTTCSATKNVTEIPVKGHSWAEATCTAAKKCSVCGATDGNALGHSYTSKVTKAATCTADGIRTYTCSRCSDSYTEAITKTGHISDSGTITKQPTCTATGIKTYKCTVCTALLETETIAAKGHSWTAATCTAAKKCSVCGATDGSALGHSYTSKVTKAATCTANGIRTYTCSRCSDSYTEAITKTGHISDSGTITKYPSCAAEGAIKYYCTVCFEYLYSETIPTLEHTKNSGRVTKFPTCTEPGSKYFSCTVCGVVLYTEELPMLEHTSDGGYITKHPTCTETGIKTYKCTECGNTLSTETLSANGHSWKEATCISPKTCNTCGVTEGEVSGHNYKYLIEKEATCKEKGIKKFICIVCRDSYTEAIPETDHINNGGVVINPTCTEPGVTIYRCRVCNWLLSEQYVPANGHSYINHGAQAPTCTEIGWNEYQTCENCDYSTYEEISATGHTDTDENNICDECENIIDESKVTEPSESTTEEPEKETTEAPSEEEATTSEEEETTVPAEEDTTSDDETTKAENPSEETKTTEAPTEPSESTTAEKEATEKPTETVIAQKETTTLADTTAPATTTTQEAEREEPVKAAKPAKVKIKKPKSTKKKQIIVSWNKVKTVNGYQVAYSTSKKFKKKLTKTKLIKKTKTTKTTLKKLKSGKKYFIKIRAYKTVNSKKIYGAYSKVMSVKVK